MGFIVEVAGIVGAIVALAIARAEYRPVQQVLATVITGSPWLTVISYLVVFLAVWALVWIAARLLRRAARSLLLGPFDRLGGAIIGVLQSVVLIELLLYLGKRVPNVTVHDAIRRSTMAPLFLRVVPYIHHLFPAVPG